MSADKIITPQEEGEPILMTPEKLRTYPGLENLPDERAEKIIHTLYQLVAIYFDTYEITRTYCIENQIDVYWEEQKQAA